MKTFHYSIFAVLFFLLGCATVKPTVQHQYELSVVDVNGKPIEGVKIDYTLKDLDNIVESSSYTTASDGFLMKNLNAKYWYGHGYYNSEFHFNATKDNYYSQSGTMSSNYSGRPYSQFKEQNKITLIQASDYFNKEFASTLSDVTLKRRILSFIDLIIMQGLLSESVLETQSVNLISFKGNSYLQFKFTNVNVFNSLRLNKYDIGKLLFDDVIRKVLNPLNEYVAESNLFYGYDIKVIGHTKSFADEDANPEQIEYRFMIPEKIVRQYKNKDITGQQVLDTSVILMNDERIELKLQ